jgi:hypothetical protein
MIRKSNECRGRVPLEQKVKRAFIRLASGAKGSSEVFSYDYTTAPPRGVPGRDWFERIGTNHRPRWDLLIVNGTNTEE